MPSDCISSAQSRTTDSLASSWSPASWPKRATASAVFSWTRGRSARAPSSGNGRPPAPHGPPPFVRAPGKRAEARAGLRGFLRDARRERARLVERERAPRALGRPAAGLPVPYLGHQKPQLFRVVVFAVRGFGFALQDLRGFARPAALQEQHAALAAVRRHVRLQDLGVVESREGVFPALAPPPRGAAGRGARGRPPRAAPRRRRGEVSGARAGKSRGKDRGAADPSRAPRRNRRSSP